MSSLSPGLDQHVSSYAGIEGEKLVKLMFRFSSNVQATIAETFIAYCGTKLSSQFQIKDQAKKISSTQFSLLCKIFQKAIYRTHKLSTLSSIYAVIAGFF